MHNILLILALICMVNIWDGIIQNIDAYHNQALSHTLYHKNKKLRHNLLYFIRIHNNIKLHESLHKVNNFHCDMVSSKSDYCNSITCHKVIHMKNPSLFHCIAFA